MPNKYFIHTEQTKKKISDTLKKIGHRPKKQFISFGDKNPARRPEVRKKISIARKGQHNSIKTEFKKGYRKGLPSWNKGITHNKEWRQQHSEQMRGKNNPNWKDGKSFEKYTINWTKTLKRSIRERDKYICQICNLQQGDRAFPVHHIDYNKQNCNPDNLITLCLKCHIKTNYKREYWTNYFKINEFFKKEV